MRRTSASANDRQPCSANARFSANAMSAAVSSRVPSRSNNTADKDCPRHCAAAPLCIERDADGAVIAAHDGGMDLGALHRIAQLTRHQHVIDSPPDVPRPGIREMTPPRIMAVALGKQPESVHKTRIHQRLESS